MKKIVSLLIGAYVFLVTFSSYAISQDTPIEFRPRINSIKNCTRNFKNEIFCLQYFADELELVVGNSIYKPLPLRVEELSSIRYAIGESVADEYEFYSDRFSQKLNLNLDAVEKVREAGFDKIVRIRFKNLNNEQDLLRLIAIFSQDNNVKGIYLTSEVKAVGHTNDPLAKDQWYLKKESFDEAHNIAGFGSPEIHTTFFDTGYDTTHEDLPQPFGYFNHITNVKEIPRDVFGHGTAVAGMMMQIPNNEKGGVGTSPGVSIWVRKVLDDNGTGEWKTISEAIVAQTIECVNLRKENPNVRCTFSFSFSGLGPIPSIDASLDMAYKEGIVAAAAAGNNQISLDRFPIYPAAKPGTIAAAALNVNDQLASFSGYGKESLMTAAGGVGILTTIPKKNKLPGLPNETGYQLWGGTSFSAPQVVGAINLAWSKYRNLTAEQIKLLTVSSSDALPHLRPYIASGGRLNALMMVDIDALLEETPGSPLYFSIRNVSHISVKISQAFGGKIVGFTHFISDEPFNETTLNRRNVRRITTIDPTLQHNQNEIIEKLIGNLPEITTHYSRMIAFNRVGNMSPLSDALEFTTKKSELFILRNFTTEAGDPDLGQWYQDYGPLSFASDPRPWHISNVMPSPSGETQFYLRFGRRNALDYYVGGSNAAIKSEIIDLRGLNGASLTFDYFQNTSPLVSVGDTFQVFAISIDSNSNQDLDWTLLKEYEVSENSTAFRMTEKSIDLSLVAGKKFRLGFAVLSRTGGLFGGMGWMFGNVKVFTDQREYLF